MKNNFRDGFVYNKDVKLYYKSFGEGKSVLVIHGGPGYDHSLMLDFEELSENYRIIFYDQRGSGKSSGELNTESINISNFIEDIESLRLQLNLGKVILLGHSWGSILGLRYITKYSENVESGIFFSAFATSEVLNDYFNQIAFNIDPEDLQQMSLIENSEKFKSFHHETVLAYLQLSVKPFFYNNGMIPLLKLNMTERTLRNQPIIAKLLLKELESFNLHLMLKGLKNPILLIHGLNDPMPIEAPRIIKSILANCKLIEIPNCGHFPFIENKNEVFFYIKNFLAEN